MQEGHPSAGIGHCGVTVFTEGTRRAAAKTWGHLTAVLCMEEVWCVCVCVCVKGAAARCT